MGTLAADPDYNRRGICVGAAYSAAADGQAAALDEYGIRHVCVFLLRQPPDERIRHGRGNVADHDSVYHGVHQAADYVFAVRLLSDLRLRAADDMAGRREIQHAYDFARADEHCRDHGDRRGIAQDHREMDGI